jgi:hypothetical protein
LAARDIAFEFLKFRVAPFIGIGHRTSLKVLSLI